MARTSYGLINPLSCGGGTAIPRGDEKTIGQADAPLPCLTAPQAGPRKPIRSPFANRRGDVRQTSAGEIENDDERLERAPVLCA
jgi:hypothetical protein